MRGSLALAFALFVVPVVSGCSGDDDDGGDGQTDDGGDTGDDAGDDGAESPCGEIDGRCVELTPGADDQTALGEALINAQEGDVIFLHAGIYRLERSLSLDVDGVTIQGEGHDVTTLSFAGAGMEQGAQGLRVTADDFTARDFAVEDTAGDAIKVEGGSRIVFHGVRAEWTGEQSAENGAYGIYPVQCSDVLIEDSIVIGASDAGIYVGQSQRAVVRRNEVRNNVAGIEIENTFDADVYGNKATGNTGGILVFNLPELQVKDGVRTRVFENDINENNGDNFAPPGNTVAMVPPGTGIVVLAADQIEIFGNTISNNMSFQLGIISYLLLPDVIEDEEYNPYSDTIYVHDNTFVGGGDMPSGLLGGVVRAQLDAVLMEAAPEAIPDISFDHILDPEKTDVETGELLPEFNLCLQENGEADFVSLDAGGEFAGLNLDATPYDCAHDPLPPVVLQGVPL